MLVLGIDPSLTNFGWALYDTEAPVGDPARCPARGRFSTPSDMEFVERYISQRESLRSLIQRVKPDKVGIEFPVFDQMYSEGMYGLFLYSCEALKLEKMDVVFWAPLQLKARAREFISRPPGWKMEKPDMVESAQVCTGIKMNHNEADAFFAGLLSASFWRFHGGEILESGLSPVEKKLFANVHTYTRGKKAGKTVKTGMIYREEERFFLWSNTEMIDAPCS